MVVVTLDQQCNTGEKPTVMMYTYYVHINRHAGTQDKNKAKTFLVHKKNRFTIIYSNSAIESALIQQGLLVWRGEIHLHFTTSPQGHSTTCLKKNINTSRPERCVYKIIVS